MPQHLRAYLYDPAYGSGDKLVENIFTDWSSGNAIAIIPSNFPKSLVEKMIIHTDPSEVIDLKSDSAQKRELAIVDTPDLAAVVLTSGTTGSPKPVELGFGGMKSSVEALYKAADLNSRDTWLCCVPPHYVAGLSILARSFINGSNLIFHDSFEVEDIRTSLENNEVTAISLVPFQLQKLLQSKVDLSVLNAVLVGGGSVDPNLVEECKLQNIPIRTTYGMTETWGGICLDGHFLENTAGRIDNNEIEISTTSLMLGYRHNYPATIAKLTPDHWYRTGDRGKIIENKIEVYGRSDETIISGGIKIDPIPLEKIVRSIFPNQEIAIVPTIHKSLGQCTTVCFLTSDKDVPKLEEIRSALIEHVPSTQMPARLATCDTFPMSAVGKLLREKLSKSCKIIEEHISE